MSVEKKVLIGFATVLIGLFTVSAYFYNAKNEYIQTNHFIVQNGDALYNMERVIADVLLIIVAQRGYELTQEESTLEPYRRGLLNVFDHLNNVREMTKDSPSQQRRIDSLEQLVKSRIKFSEQLIAETRKSKETPLTAEEKKSEAAERLAGRIRGQTEFTQIRALIIKMQNEEKERLLSRIEGNEKRIFESGAVFIVLISFIAFILTAVYLLVTATLRARRKSESNERSIRTLFELSMESLKTGSILSIDKQYNILNFNSTWREAQHTAYGTDPKIGMNLLDTITNDSDSTKVKEFFDMALEGKSHITTEQYGDKIRYYFENRWNTMRNEAGEIIGATVFSSNITERMESENQIRKLAAIVDSSPDAIISCSLDGKIVSWNPGAENIFGYTPAEIIGKHISILAPPDHKSEEKDILIRMMRKEKLDQFESKRLTKSGKVIPVSSSIFHLTDGRGNVTGVSNIAHDITARKEAEEQVQSINKKLEEASQLLKSSIESLQSGTIFSVDSEYRILNFNSTWKNDMQAAYGTVVEIGVGFLDVITNDRDRAAVKKFVDLSLAGESHITSAQYGDATRRRYVETHWNPMRNRMGEIIGATAISYNVTQRMESENQIRRLAGIVEASTDAIISKFIDGTILSWNKGAEKMFGYTTDEVIGKHHSMLIAPDFQEEENKMIERIRRKELIPEFETKMIGKDGVIIYVSAAVSPMIDEHEEVIGVSKIAHDITERKAAEGQIRAMNIKLQEARQSADAANEAKSQFLANMSHEIRTPLNAVIGLSHLALKTELTPKQLDYLSKILSSSESLLSIINDILDFSKIEAGRLSLEEVNFDLEEVFQNLVNVTTYKAHAKGLEVAFGIESNVPMYLIGDPTRLGQILTNLCSNAVKFTEKGEVVIKVGVIQEMDDHVNLRFEVRDTGIGMSEEQLNKLFSPFTQADNTISRRFGGTGLGLSIIKRLVEMLGGTVAVTSESGKGSAFSFEISFKKQLQQYQLPVPSIDLRKLNVVIVDDNQSALSILTGALKSFSFNVVSFNSAVDALDYLRNNPDGKTVKLVILDWKMPALDGLDAANIVRGDKHLTRLKIILMCNSHDEEELSIRAEGTNLNGLLIKPLRYSSLFNTIIHAMDDETSHSSRQNKIEVTKITASPRPGGHLLLAEDLEINQQVACELLQSFGFVVDVANNGKEAVQAVLHGNPKYDLVLMDVQMPVMGGLEATRLIRKSYRNTDLPIVAMTADAVSGVMEKCLQAGMDDFIPKPIDPDKMLETIKKWINKKPGNPTPVIQQKNPSEKRIESNEALAGIDTADGIRRVGGNKIFYYEMLKKFRINHGQFNANLKELIAAGVAEDARKLVHKLKGVSGNLGMTNLHALCEKMEDALKNERTTDVQSLATALSNELENILKSLQGITETNQS